MAAYVIERNRWKDGGDLIPQSHPAAEEDQAKQWLRDHVDWRWHLVDAEAKECLKRLATGMRDVQAKKIDDMPTITVGDDLLLLRRVPHASAEPKKPGKEVRKRKPDWVYWLFHVHARAGR